MAASERIYLSSAAGPVCCWEAADPAARPALEMLRECTGLPAESAVEADYCCRIGVINPALLGQYYVKRVRMGFLPPGEDGSREIHLARWDEGPDRRNNGFRVQFLYFQGVMPLLERHRSFWVHCALLERDGEGVMICGPSGMGKSTTALRLSQHYRVLADDCALLTRRDDGWHAQPVPTWSVWTSGKPRRWRFDCSRSVPLRSVFLLERGEDRIIDVAPETAVLGLVPAFTDLVGIQMSRHPDPMRHAMFNRAFDGACRLVRELPARRLSLTLESDACRVIAASSTRP